MQTITQEQLKNFLITVNKPNFFENEQSSNYGNENGETKRITRLRSIESTNEKQIRKTIPVKKDETSGLQN